MSVDISSINVKEDEKHRVEGDMSALVDVVILAEVDDLNNTQRSSKAMPKTSHRGPNVSLAENLDILLQIVLAVGNKVRDRNLLKEVKVRHLLLRRELLR